MQEHPISTQLQACSQAQQQQEAGGSLLNSEKAQLLREEDSGRLFVKQPGEGEVPLGKLPVRPALDPRLLNPTGFQVGCDLHVLALVVLPSWAQSLAKHAQMQLCMPVHHPVAVCLCVVSILCEGKLDMKFTTSLSLYYVCLPGQDPQM